MSEAPAFESRRFVKHLMDSGFTEGLRSAGRGEKIHEVVGTLRHRWRSGAGTHRRVVPGGAGRVRYEPDGGRGPARLGDLRENWLDVPRAERLIGWRPEIIG